MLRNCNLFYMDLSIKAGPLRYKKNFRINLIDESTIIPTPFFYTSYRSYRVQLTSGFEQLVRGTADGVAVGRCMEWKLRLIGVNMSNNKEYCHFCTCYVLNPPINNDIKWQRRDSTSIFDWTESVNMWRGWPLCPANVMYMYVHSKLLSNGLSKCWISLVDNLLTRLKWPQRQYNRAWQALFWNCTSFSQNEYHIFTFVLFILMLSTCHFIWKLNIWLLSLIFCLNVPHMKRWFCACLEVYTSTECWKRLVASP